MKLIKLLLVTTSWKDCWGAKRVKWHQTVSFNIIYIMENLKNTKPAFFTTEATRKKDKAGETYWLKMTQGT